MINILSLFSVVGIFTTAVNLMCAATPATVMSILHITGNM